MFQRRFLVPWTWFCFGDMKVCAEINNVACVHRYIYKLCCGDFFSTVKSFLEFIFMIVLQALKHIQSSQFHPKRMFTTHSSIPTWTFAVVSVRWMVSFCWRMQTRHVVSWKAKGCSSRTYGVYNLSDGIAGRCYRLTPVSRKNSTLWYSTVLITD